MRHSVVYGTIFALCVMVAAIPAKAALVTPASCIDDDPFSSFSVGFLTGGGLAGISCAFTDEQGLSKITVTEEWNSDAAGFLRFSGLDENVNYILEKIINNNTNVDFTSIGNELLDPTSLNPNGSSADNTNDADDLLPPPGFVPDGFGTSNENDGLSFAQGSGVDPLIPDVARSSDSFGTIDPDELKFRDFLDFTGGSGIAANSTGTIKYGLRDTRGINDPTCIVVNTKTVCLNDGFLIAQRPNFDVIRVPEPSTALIFGLGLIGLDPIRI